MFKWLFKKKGCAKHMNNKLEVIGIDHGWSMMKTISQVFVTGVKEITTTPALFGDVLEYEGKYIAEKCRSCCNLLNTCDKYLRDCFHH